MCRYVVVNLETWNQIQQMYSYFMLIVLLSLKMDFAMMNTVLEMGVNGNESF